LLRNDYPETVTEVLDDAMRFSPAILRAVRDFANSRPWSGSLDDRKAKFRALNAAMALACGISAPELAFGEIDGSFSGASHYNLTAHRVVLVGRLSVVTVLHEWGHVLGFGERDATAFSVNLFRRCFPKQYGRLLHRGHTLLNTTASSR
jgi:hypothetical protein